MRKDELDEIYQDLRYDKGDLEQVWSKQAELFFKYGVKSALAEEIASKAKGELDSLEAKLYESLRIEKEHSGYKWTEATINSKIKIHPTYIEKLQQVLMLRRDADIYKSAMEAFRHRRDMVVQSSKAAILEFEQLGNTSFKTSK